MKYLGVGSVLLAACLFTACEKPKDDDAAKAPAAEAEKPAAEAPKSDANSMASGAPKGEPPSPSQPQPVYPDGR